MTLEQELAQLVEDEDVDAVDDFIAVHLNEVEVTDALIRAAENQDHKMIKVLLRGYHDSNDLIIAICRIAVGRNDNETVKVLLDYGLNPNIALGEITDLLFRIYEDPERFPIMETILSREVDVGLVNEVLYKAVKLNRRLLVHLLLENGANPNTANRSPNEERSVDVLTYALTREKTYGFNYIAIDLINHGAKIASPLFKSSNYDVIKAMLENGADVHEGSANYENGEKDIILLFSISNRLDYDIIKLLLYYKSDLRKYNNEIIRRVVSYPSRSEMMNILILLIFYGANPDIIVDGGWLFKESELKRIFNARLARMKLGSRQAWDFWIKWAPRLRNNYQETIEPLKKQRAQIWGYPVISGKNVKTGNPEGYMKYDEPIPRRIEEDDSEGED